MTNRVVSLPFRMVGKKLVEENVAREEEFCMKEW